MKQGIIMEIQTNAAYVFTNECNLIKMPAKMDMFVGQSIQLPEAPVRIIARRRWLIPALAAACAVLLLCTGLLLSTILLPRAGTVFLSLDINPSIEFTLDANRIVIDVVPLNSDAWEMLNKTSLTGLNYEEAIVRWINLLRENRPEIFENLLITAILDKRDREFADQIMALDGDQAAQRLAVLAGLDVKVLFSTDQEIKKEADANKISIGRQMLLNKARERHLNLDVETIRTGSLKELLGDLLAAETGNTTGTLQVTAATSETTAATTTIAATTTTVEETTQATTLASTTAKPVETTKETTKATTKASTGLTISAANSSEGWKLNWTLSPSNKALSYYKVVISKTDSTPTYPDNGYLFALSERNSNQCTANNASQYNGGDFGGYLTVGQKYYVGITYVFNDGTRQYSNVLQLKYSGPPHVEETTAPTAAFSPVMTASSDDAGFHLSWTASPADRSLSYYKVVISPSVSTPVYPDNGYLYVLSASETACTANNTSAYHDGDVGGLLVVGQQYYVAITYVFSDCKISSNVQQLTYIGP